MGSVGRLNCRARAAGGIVLALLACGPGTARVSSALDPSKAITQYPQAQWTADRGLAQNNAHAVVQDRDGYLWIGTESGLSRFDGVQFTLFFSSNTPGMLNNSVFAACVDRRGDLWVGTEGGLVRRTAGRFQTYTTVHGLPSAVIHAVREDGTGVLWVGTSRGLVRMRPDASAKRTVDDSEEGSARRANDGVFEPAGGPAALGTDRIRAVFVARDGSVWIGTDTRGLFRYKDGSWTEYTTKNGLAMDRIWAIHDDKEGNVWIGTYGEGLSRFRDGTFTHFTPEQGLAHRFVYALLEDRHGSLWIGTEKGLSRWRNGAFETARSADGLGHDRIWSLYEDREGNLWAGTRGGGLLRFSDGWFTTFGRRQGLVGENIYSIAEDAEGGLWVAALGSGLSHFKGARVLNFGREHGLVEPDRMWTVFSDSRGRVWAGGDAGLFLLRGARFQHEQTLRDVRALYEDRAGRLWVGTYGHGLGRLEAGRFTVLTTKDGLPDDSVVALREDREGGLWIGTHGRGLVRLKDGAFQRFTVKDGLPSDSVRFIHEDRQGALWLGTTGGLARLEAGHFTKYTMREGLHDDVIFQVMEDGAGDLWLGSTRGIFKVARQDLDEVAHGTRAAVRVTVFGPADGLAVSSCTGASTPSGWQGRDGRLWFPTQGGAAAVDPGRPLGTVLPTVVVEEVIADRRHLAPASSIELAAGTRDVEVHYTALSLRAPETVRFRYRLEPFDDDWLAAGSRRTAYYNNLKPGRYRFAVGASLDGTGWSENDSLEATLHPFFYQTRWFLGACLATLIGSAVSAYALRVRALTARQRFLAARVEEELNRVKVLRGLLPICASCKKIRDDQGYWSHVETYIGQHSQADFSHGICPDCLGRLYPDYVEEAEKELQKEDDKEGRR